MTMSKDPIHYQVIDEWEENYRHLEEQAKQNGNDFERHVAHERVVFIKMLSREITKRENAGVYDE